MIGLGTVIEGRGEFKSSRIANKDRKQTLLDEVMADSSIKSYSKRKFMEIQDRHNDKIKMYKAKKQNLKGKKKHIKKF